MNVKPPAHPVRAFFFLAIFSQIANFATLRADEAGQLPPTPQQLAFFENKIRPLLAEHCYECHSRNATNRLPNIKRASST